MKPNFEEINRAIDMIMRPHVVFMHPDDAELLRSTFPRIDEDVIIQPIPYIEKGKAVLLDRKKVKEWMKILWKE